MGSIDANSNKVKITDLRKMSYSSVESSSQSLSMKSKMASEDENESTKRKRSSNESEYGFSSKMKYPIYLNVATNYVEQQKIVSGDIAGSSHRSGNSLVGRSIPTCAKIKPHIRPTFLKN